MPTRTMLSAPCPRLILRPKIAVPLWTSLDIYRNLLWTMLSGDEDNYKDADSVPASICISASTVTSGRVPPIGAIVFDQEHDRVACASHSHFLYFVVEVLSSNFFGVPGFKFPHIINPSLSYLSAVARNEKKVILIEPLPIAMHSSRTAQPPSRLSGENQRILLVANDIHCSLTPVVRRMSG